MTSKAHYEANPVMFRNNPIGFVLALLLCFMGVGFLILGAWWFQCKATTLTVTDERTILRKGIFSKSINEVWHRDVRNVQLRQGFLQRIFGVGSIGISSAGQSGIEVGVSGIPDPEQVKLIIDQYRRQAT